MVGITGEPGSGNTEVREMGMCGGRSAVPGPDEPGSHAPATMPSLPVSAAAPAAGPKPASRIKVLLGLHLLLALFSMSGIMSKLASGFPFLSLGFIGCYGAMVCILGVYALGWQQVIKRMPLTSAYANRAITVVWGIVWGAVLFGESVSAPKFIGALVVLAGVALYATADGEDAPAADVPSESVPAAGAPSVQAALHDGVCTGASGVAASPALGEQSAVAAPSSTAPKGGEGA